MAVMAYDITLEIDKCRSIVKLDSTYPSVRNWHTATEFAIHLAMHDHPEAQIEFIDCAEYEHEEYTKYGFIHETPCALQ
mgnify:CR=1 FL=1|jgi:hypothetical protein|tara:strand:- start:130 stop:366 length:237 start_codon:yes stop_codon:yes gene_type:complete